MLSGRAWSSTRTACSMRHSRRTGRCSPFSTLSATDSVCWKTPFLENMLWNEPSAHFVIFLFSRYGHGSPHQQGLPEAHQTLQGAGQPSLQGGSVNSGWIFHFVLICKMRGKSTVHWHLHLQYNLVCGVWEQSGYKPRWSTQEMLRVREASANLRRHYSGKITISFSIDINQHHKIIPSPSELPATKNHSK